MDWVLIHSKEPLGPGCNLKTDGQYLIARCVAHCGFSTCGGSYEICQLQIMHIEEK